MEGADWSNGKISPANWPDIWRDYPVGSGRSWPSSLLVLHPRRIFKFYGQAHPGHFRHIPVICLYPPCRYPPVIRLYNFPMVQKIKSAAV
jgi:hypothetical protein